MPKSAPYLFCRYQIRDNEDEPVSADNEWKLLRDLKGQLVAHRVREPKKEDFDTYLIKPRKKQINSYRVHTWEVAQDIRFRERTRYQKDADDLTNDVVRTEEIRHTKFLAVPSLGVFAVDDHISERSLSI